MRVISKDCSTPPCQREASHVQPKCRSRQRFCCLYLLYLNCAYEASASAAYSTSSIGVASRHTRAAMLAMCAVICPRRSAKVKDELARLQTLAQRTDHYSQAIRTFRHDKSFDPHALYCTIFTSQEPGLTPRVLYDKINRQIAIPRCRPARTK